MITDLIRQEIPYKDHSPILNICEKYIKIFRRLTLPASKAILPRSVYYFFGLTIYYTLLPLYSFGYVDRRDTLKAFYDLIKSQGYRKEIPPYPQNGNVDIVHFETKPLNRSVMLVAIYYSSYLG